MEREKAMSAAQIEKAFAAWPHVEPTLRVPHNDCEYRQLVKLLDRLVDDLGENEDHPLASMRRDPTSPLKNPHLVAADVSRRKFLAETEGRLATTDVDGYFFNALLTIAGDSGTHHMSQQLDD